MISITTPDGTFEADTEREALKLSRKAKRAAAADQKRFDAHYGQARLRAMANGYWIYDRMAESKHFPRGWIFHAPGTRFSSVTIKARGGSWVNLTIHGEHGTADYNLNGVEFLGTVENGAGFCIAIAYEFAGEKQIHAMGVDGNAAHAVRLHGITIDQFNTKTDEGSAAQ